MTRNQRTDSKSLTIYLRRPRPDDFAELDRLHTASRKHFAGLVETEHDRAKFERLLANAESEANESFVICRTEDAQIMGQVNLSQIFRGTFQNAYLGYHLFSGFTGNGHMTEAVAQTLSFAFTVLELHRVEANVQPVNLPSIKVLKRNGFTKEGYSRRYLKIGGRWRDHERWAIIREDWKKR